MIEMEIVQNRELLQYVGRLTSATCADLNTLRRQSRGLSEENTQEPESSRSQQTRVSPRGSTRDPFLSCCPLIPLLCRYFCGL